MILHNLLLTIAWAAAVQSTSAQTPAPPATPAAPIAAVSARRHEDLAGTWKYNPDQSVNAATGRSETIRSANDRRGGTAGGGAPRVGPPGGGAGIPSSGPDPGGSPGGGGGLSGPPSAALNMFQQSRDTLRDLMEIAPELTIAVTPSTVTVTDDLKRALSFPTDGRKQKQQLGAAVFDARTRWDGPQLREDIEGPNGLRVTETYLLSEDGSRLFLIIRIGEQVKGERPNGVNRVYDRVK